MIAWKDVTSYRQGDREHVPTTWAATFGDLRIVVLNRHISAPGRWVMHCHPWFETHDLELDASRPLETAQGVAISIVRAQLEKMLAALGDAS